MTHTPQSRPRFRGLRAKAGRANGPQLLIDVGYRMGHGATEVEARRRAAEAAYPSDRDRDDRETAKRWLRQQMGTARSVSFIEKGKAIAEAEIARKGEPGTIFAASVSQDDEDRVVAGDHDFVAAIAVKARVSKRVAWRVLKALAT